SPSVTARASKARRPGTGCFAMHATARGVRNATKRDLGIGIGWCHANRRRRDLEVALLLERLQMIVHAVGRADAHVLADLAQRRRIAAALDRLADELQHRLLAIGQRLFVVFPADLHGHLYVYLNK